MKCTLHLHIPIHILLFTLTSVLKLIITFFLIPVCRLTFKCSLLPSCSYWCTVEWFACSISTQYWVAEFRTTNFSFFNFMHKCFFECFRWYRKLVSLLALKIFVKNLRFTFMRRCSKISKKNVHIKSNFQYLILEYGRMLTCVVVKNFRKKKN